MSEADVKEPSGANNQMQAIQSNEPVEETKAFDLPKEETNKEEIGDIALAAKEESNESLEELEVQLERIENVADYLTQEEELKMQHEEEEEDAALTTELEGINVIPEYQTEDLLEVIDALEAKANISEEEEEAAAEVEEISKADEVVKKEFTDMSVQTEPTAVPTADIQLQFPENNPNNPEERALTAVEHEDLAQQAEEAVRGSEMHPNARFQLSGDFMGNPYELRVDHDLTAHMSLGNEIVSIPYYINLTGLVIVLAFMVQFFNIHHYISARYQETNYNLSSLPYRIGWPQSFEGYILVWISGHALILVLHGILSRCRFRARNLQEAGQETAL